MGFPVTFSYVYIMSFDDIHPTTLSYVLPILSSSSSSLLIPTPHSPLPTLPFFFRGFVYRPVSLMKMWARHLFTQQPMNCQ